MKNRGWLLAGPTKDLTPPTTTHKIDISSFHPWLWSVTWSLHLFVIGAATGSTKLLERYIPFQSSAAANIAIQKYSALLNTQFRRKALLFCTKEYAPSDISSALWNIAIWINWNWLFDILFSKVTACRPQQGLRFVWTNGLLSPAAATLLAWKHLRRSGSFLSGVEGMRLTCFAFLAARYSIFRYPLAK